MIDERAIIHPSAKVASDVTIGPWTSIGEDVEIGPGCWIGPHVIINGPTKLGPNNRIYQFASIGEAAQDKKFKGETAYLEIGEGNTIREFCTFNRGTSQGGGITRIGNHNWFMAYVHIAHDCQVGNYITFANNATLGGHVVVEDYASLGGFAGIHQFCHIGAYSFLAKGTFVSQDVLPYVMVSGFEAKTYGLNAEGLRRHQFSAETIETLKRAYKIIFRQGLTVADAVALLAPMVAECPEVQRMITALENSVRGIVR